MVKGGQQGRHRCVRISVGAENFTNSRDSPGVLLKGGGAAFGIDVTRDALVTPHRFDFLDGFFGVFLICPVIVYGSTHGGDLVAICA